MFVPVGAYLCVCVCVFGGGGIWRPAAEKPILQADHWKKLDNYHV